MTIKTMLQLCDMALARLDVLEALLEHIPPERKAFEFIHTSAVATYELKDIARYETRKSVTVEQASHIYGILATTAILLNLVPARARKELNGE